MRKLIGWEVVVTVLTLLVYTVCLLYFGMKPDEAPAVVVAFAAAVAAPAAAVAFAAAAAAAVVVAAPAAFIVASELKLKYRWVLLSLVIEGAAIYTGIVYGSRFIS